jgi:Na+-transporting methylmalonyl-CoA/oxaloacetate decarboxylase beta subunit
MEKDKMKKIIGIVLLSIGVISVLAGLAGIVTLLRANANSVPDIAIIGGADGPTAVFLAGKIGMPWFGTIIAGVVLTIIGIILFKKEK